MLNRYNTCVSKQINLPLYALCVFVVEFFLLYYLWHKIFRASATVSLAVARLAQQNACATATDSSEQEPFRTEGLRTNPPPQQRLYC